MSLSSERLVEMYRRLCGSRMAEQAITDLAKQGVLGGHHSGLGHESIGVAVGMAVRPGDGVQPSHRSGMMLAHARGDYSLREAILSRIGLAPVHTAPRDPGRSRMIMVVGLVASQLPLAVGTAMADRFKRKDSVIVCFFGDGGANEGAIHEGMNLAGARKLPMVFIVENNGFSVSMPVREATAAVDYASRAAGYGMPGVTVDGQDAMAVHEAVQAAVDRARRGEGPSMVEVVVVRWEAHSLGIPDLRSETEMAQAREHDGVAILRRRLIEMGVLGEAQLRAIESECRAEVDAAVAELRSATRPVSGPRALSDADAWRLSYAEAGP
jgi:TPP-dependent pyruvate/acetoin dehydrogenase alpha subunit